MQKNNIFETMKMPKLILQMAIPSIIAMLVIVLYNMADTFFIGQTNNSAMLAAVSVATPVFMLLVTLGSLIGIGGSACISQALGRKDYDQVKKISSFCAWIAIIVGTIYAIVVNVYIEPICSMLGASPETLDYAKEYVSIIGLSAPVTIFSGVNANLIRSEGSSKESMFGNIIGTFLNIILDPILILSMNMGVKGAAIATLISNVVASLYYCSYYFWKKDTKISISPKYFSINPAIIKMVVLIGLPAAITNLLGSVSIVFVNKILYSYGDASIAAMGVSIKLLLLTSLLQVGLSNGVLPIMSYCRGANLKERFTGCLKWSVIYSVSLGSVLGLFMFMFRYQLLSAFTTDTQIYQLAETMTGILLMSAPVIGLYTISIASLQSMNNPRSALFVSILRQGLYFIPLLYILQPMLGEMGIILAQPISDFLSVITALILVRYILKKKEMW